MSAPSAPPSRYPLRRRTSRVPTMDTIREESRSSRSSSRQMSMMSGDSILKAFLQRDAPTVYGVLFFMTVLLFTSVGAGLYAYQMHRETIMAQWEKFGLGNFLGAMLLKQLDKAGAFRPPCAWPITIDPDDFTPVMLDTNSRYHILALRTERMPPFLQQRNKTYRIRSLFQQVTYFSVQSYDIAGEPIDSIMDYQLKPSSGKNPFVDPTATLEEGLGSYDIYLTQTGQEGYPNEMRLFPQGEEASGMSQESGVSMFMMRLYGKDTRAVPIDETSTESWGSVPPPVVQQLKEHKDGSREWITLPMCTADMRTNLIARLKRLSDMVLRRVPTESAKEAVCPAWHPKLRVEGPGGDFHARQHMMPFQGDAMATAMQKIPYSNKDSSYTFWCAKTDRVRGPSFVLKLTGTLPTIPKGLFDSPRIADVRATDMRYVSLNTVDSFQPKPTYQSIAGNEIEAFYADKWRRGVRGNRTFSLIVADTKEEAVRSGLYDPEDDLLLTYEHPDVRPPHVPTVIYRQLIAQAQVLPHVQDKSIYTFIEKCKEEPHGHCIRNGVDDPELSARQRQLSRDVQQEYHLEGEVYLNPREGGGGRATLLHKLL